MSPAIGTWISTEDDPYGHGPMHIADVRGWGHLTRRGGGCAFTEDKAVAIQNANARLIAAAPDMLAALKLCRANFEDSTERLVSFDHTIGCVRAAIAKAEGR